MKQGIQDEQTGNLKEFGCAYLCLLQLLKPELEGPPNIAIPESLMGSDYFIKDWVLLYNWLNEKLGAGKGLVIGCLQNNYLPNTVQICKNVKADNKTTHFTLRKNKQTFFDPLNPNRKAAGEYIYHYPYQFV